MKKQLLKKFSACLPACLEAQPLGMAFIVTAMMYSASANAQIVYTDVNPDILQFCTATSLNSCFIEDSIDINNDGIFDLKLQGAAAAVVQQNPPMRIGYIRVSPLHASAVNTDTSGKPLSMNLNDVIDAGGSWLTAASQILISSQSAGIPLPSGNWLAGTDKYLGLKIVSGNQINYGWIQLNISSTPTAASFTIKDYAYNSTPNQPILAGQTVVTGISPLSFGEGLGVRLFPNPANNHLTINLEKDIRNVQVTIADITGKIIYKTTGTDLQKLEVNTTNFVEGVYVVQIQTADFIATKKLVVEK